MVAFVTLFLGLVAGVQEVELAVSGEVAAVELFLDGGSAGVVREAPWRLPLDLGSGLSPHELVAVGFDSEGREVARTDQWINLPRPRTEVRLVLDEDEGADPSVPRSARLVWGSVDAVRPDAVRLTLDGTPFEELEGAGFDGRSIQLPPLDPEELHLLRAEIRLGEAFASAELPLGGEVERVERALTAVPARLAGAEPPAAREMAGWLTHRGKPLRVVGVERAASEVVMVQDLSWGLQGRLKRVRELTLAPRGRPFRPPTGLKHGDRFRLLLPVPVESPETRSLQFPMSPDLWAEKREVYSQGAGERRIPGPVAEGILAGVPAAPEKRVDTADQRLADAVATAGLAAVESGRARAVVLVLGGEAEDRSRFDPAAVRAYLERLRVPLVVWSPQPRKVDPAWGEVVETSNPQRMERAIRDLRALLDEQVTVWVEGRHAPHEIRTTPAAAGGLELVGEPAAERRPEPPESLELPGALEPPVPVETAAMEDPPEPESQASGAAAVSFGEAVEVQVVNVDVVVADRAGRPVHGLEREDFALEVDGEPVEIRYFRAPTPPEEEAAAAGEPPTAGSSAAIAGPPAPPPSLVLFLDLFNLQPAGRGRVLGALRETLEGLGARLPPAMVVRYDDGLHVEQGFTADPARVLEAVAAADRRGSPPRVDATRRLAAEMAQVGQAFAEAQRLRGQEREIAMATASSQRDNALALVAAEARQRERELEALYAAVRGLAAGLGAVDGRKAILYAGDRLTLEPARVLFDEALNLVGGDPDDPWGGERLAARLAAEAAQHNLQTDLRALYREANAAGVTLYAVTPAASPAFLGVERGSAGAPGAEGRAVSTLNESVKAAACLMTQSTGGLCRVGGTDLQEAFRVSLEDLGAAYSLGFVPEGHADGGFHPFRVEVRGEKLRVRHREGYVAKPPAERLKDRLTAALLFGADADGLGLRITLRDLEPGPDGGSVLPVELRVSVDRLALLPVPGKAARAATARLLVSVLAADGRTTAVQEFPVTFEVPEASLQGGTAPDYLHKVSLALEPAARRVGLALWDEVGRAGSFLSRPVPRSGPAGEPPAPPAETASRAGT